MEKNEEKRTGVLNRDVFAFAFFLILSFSLWYLNSLGKEAEAEIRIPFNFISIPEGKSIEGDIPARISFTLRGPGYSILKLKFISRKTPVNIDLSGVAYNMVTEEKTPDYFLVTAGLTRDFASQLRSGCAIVSVKPDTLFFSINRRDIKSDPESADSSVLNKVK